MEGFTGIGDIPNAGATCYNPESMFLVISSTFELSTLIVDPADHSRSAAHTSCHWSGYSGAHGSPLARGSLGVVLTRKKVCRMVSYRRSRYCSFGDTSFSLVQVVTGERKEEQNV